MMMAAQQNGGPSNFAGIGDGMGAMLITVLKETGCFEIQEREAMDELAKELALVGKKVEVQQADFMISGAITAINMSTERTALGGGFIPILGAFTRTTQTADIGMDMKIIDVNRAKVVESRTFVANNETSSTKWGGAAFGGIGLFAGGMSSIKGTPMEPIVRDILARVASFASTRLVDLRGSAGGTLEQVSQNLRPNQASVIAPVTQ
jgi:curli biogenesis system outer membrane secretion channel CsgG